MFHAGRASWAATLCSPSSSLIAGPHDLGNDVAGALHDDVVAGADIFAADLIFVVQGGALT